MTALYEIANDYAKLLHSGLEPEAIADSLDGIEGALEDKASNIMAVIKNETAHAEALRTEAANLTERARLTENRIKHLKSYLALSLDTTGLKTLRAGLHQISLRAPSKSVEIKDVSALPVGYLEYDTVAKPDKNLIKQDLEKGLDIPGAVLKIGKPSVIIK